MLDFADKKSSFKEMLNEAAYSTHSVMTQPTVAGRDTLSRRLASCRANLSMKASAVPSRPGSGWGLRPPLTLKEMIQTMLVTPQLQNSQLQSAVTQWCLATVYPPPSGLGLSLAMGQAACGTSEEPGGSSDWRWPPKQGDRIFLSFLEHWEACGHERIPSHQHHVLEGRHTQLPPSSYS